DKDNALWEFNEALKAAEVVGDDFHTVDTMHMLAIVANTEEAIAWNDRAIKLAQTTINERARGWLGSLYNNQGWAYFDKGDYSTAMDIFE
ncbi:hypothetical protein, partial [Salmonella enterica]|uniref:hypothetical protein n=1 Tax=Salmonella enterica TaxID=28901 RepID=UPI003D26706A